MWLIVSSTCANSTNKTQLSQLLINMLVRVMKIRIDGREIIREMMI